MVWFVYLERIKKGVEYPTDDGYISLPLITIIGHEIAHSYSFLLKTGYQDNFWYFNQAGGKVSQDEWYATVIENYIRLDHDMPLRTHYGYRTGTNSTVWLTDEKSRVIRKTSDLTLWSETVSDPDGKKRQVPYVLRHYEIVKPDK